MSLTQLKVRFGIAERSAEICHDRFEQYSRRARLMMTRDPKAWRDRLIRLALQKQQGWLKLELSAYRKMKRAMKAYDRESGYYN